MCQKMCMMWSVKKSLFYWLYKRDKKTFWEIKKKCQIYDNVSFLAIIFQCLRIFDMIFIWKTLMKFKTFYWNKNFVLRMRKVKMNMVQESLLIMLQQFNIICTFTLSNVCLEQILINHIGKLHLHGFWNLDNETFKL